MFSSTLLCFALLFCLRFLKAVLFALLNAVNCPWIFHKGSSNCDLLVFKKKSSVKMTSDDNSLATTWTQIDFNSKNRNHEILVFESTSNSRRKRKQFERNARKVLIKRKSSCCRHYNRSHSQKFISCTHKISPWRQRTRQKRYP